MNKAKIIRKLNQTINTFKDAHLKEDKWDHEDNEDHYNELVEVRKMIEGL